MEKTIEVTEITYTPKGAKKLKTPDGYFYVQAKNFGAANIDHLGTFNVSYDGSEYQGKTINWISKALVASTMPQKQAGSPIPATNGYGIGDRARQEGIGRSVALNNACLMIDAFSRAWASTESIKNRTPEDIQEMLRSFKDMEYVKNLELLRVTPTDEDTVGM